MTVVRAANEPRLTQLDPKKRYAGVRLAALREEGRRHLASVSHVKARRSEEVIDSLPERQRDVARENAYIDLKAKEAVTRCHT